MIQKSIFTLTIVCLILPLQIFGQTLSFSDVINLKGDCTNGTHVIDTVPAGKVWKVENLALTNVTLQAWVSGNGWITLTYTNDAFPFVPPGNSTPATGFRPIWFDEGEILRANCSNIASYRYFISILEFSTTP